MTATRDPRRVRKPEAARIRVVVAATLALAACGGPQSVLDPAGADAAVLYRLFSVMMVGAVLLFCLVIGLFVWVTWISPREHSARGAEALIVGGGILFPTVVLAGLLSYGLSILPDQRAPGDGLTVRVMGEQWWWRVEYWPEGADAPVIAANEIRLPAGQRSEFVLGAERVIHSFWIPALGGKLDMFPGRETRMSLEPTRPGLYRGQCAEFCGLSHALMAFDVVVMPQAEFDAWLAREASAAAPPQEEAAERGRAVFEREGCGACHAVRGTGAVGNVGPDLTHVGSRETIGAGLIAAEVETFARWIADPEALKPGAEMPAYAFLPQDELIALGHYLEGLK